MKLMIATSVLVATGLFAQTATPPPAGGDTSKMEKKGKHKKPHTKKMAVPNR